MFCIKCDLEIEIKSETVLNKIKKNTKKDKRERTLSISSSRFEALTISVFISLNSSLVINFKILFFLVAYSQQIDALRCVSNLLESVFFVVDFFFVYFSAIIDSVCTYSILMQCKLNSENKQTKKGKI